jgi:hypothetical protein
MTSVEGKAKLLELTEQWDDYMDSYGDDAQPDWDRSFFIEEQWKAGALPVYTARYMPLAGITDSFEKTFSTYDEARDFLIWKLRGLLRDEARFAASYDGER